MFILFMHSIHAFYSIHAMRPAILFIHSTAFHLFFTAFALLLLIYPYFFFLALFCYCTIHPSILIHPSLHPYPFFLSLTFYESYPSYPSIHPIHPSFAFYPSYPYPLLSTNPSLLSFSLSFFLSFTAR